MNLPIGEQPLTDEEYAEWKKPKYWELSNPTQKNLLAYAVLLAPKAVEHLLQKGYDINEPYGGRHPIEICIDQYHGGTHVKKITEDKKNLYFNIAKSMLDKGSSYRMQELFEQVYKDANRDPKWMKLAVEKGLELKKAIPEKDLPTVVAFAVYYYGDGPYLNDAVEFFLDQGFRPNNKEDTKVYNLQYLTRKPLSETLLNRALSSYSKEDLNQTFEGDKSKLPETVLSRAISKGLLSTVKVLLERGWTPMAIIPTTILCLNAFVLITIQRAVQSCKKA